MEVALAVGVVEAFIICIEGLVVISFTTFGLDIGGPSIFSNAGFTISKKEQLLKKKMNQKIVLL